MNALPEVLGRMLRAAVFFGLVVAVLAALFVVWWIGLLLGVAVLLVWKLRGLFGAAQPAPRDRRPDVVEGEYEVERNERPAGGATHEGESRRLPPGSD